MWENWGGGSDGFHGSHKLQSPLATSAAVSAAAAANYIHNCHMMAMAFSLLGSKTGQITLDDKFVVTKTYPNYWLDYEKLT